MKVILQKPVKKLGVQGDIVEVSEGYARNFLFPKKMAIVATPKDEQAALQNMAKKSQASAQFAQWAAHVKEKISGKTIIFSEKASEKGHLFGSIAEKDIVKKIHEEFALELDASYISMKGHLKEVGETAVSVVLSPKISFSMNIHIQAA